MGSINRATFKRALGKGVDLSSSRLRASLAKTPAKLSALKKLDANRDGKLAGAELDKTFEYVDGFDKNGTARSISDSGPANAIYGALKSGVGDVAKARAAPATPRRVSHPTTDLTTGVRFQHKTATIEVHGPNNTKRSMKLVVEQRVGKPGILGQLVGPRYDKNGKVWNGVDNQAFKDIIAGKHGKGVKVANGKIVVTDPRLASRLNTLMNVYQHFRKNSGGQIQRDDGRQVKVDVNAKTRQAFTGAALQMLRHGADGKMAKRYFESNFQGGIRYSQLYFNVTAEHDAAVNRTVQRSKRYWLRSY